MNDSLLNNERPESHQRLIALMQAAVPPPADADTPSIPDELLRRLQEHYSGEAGTRTTDSLWTRVRSQINTSNLIALSACLLLLAVVAKVNFREKEDPFGTMRGLPEEQKAVRIYWLGGNDVTPAPSSPLMPKLIPIGGVDEVPNTGTVIIFDPMQKEARLIQDGQATGSFKVYDAAEAEDWISARSQLLNTLKR